MSNTNTGGPAFPTQNEHQTGNQTYHFEGMTLRDYFAAKAMQGLLAGTLTTTDTNAVAGNAYAVADAMLKARES